jgi:hypothetical protein
LTHLAEFTEDQYARYEGLSSDISRAKELIEKENPSPEDTQTAREQLASVYRKLTEAPTLPTTDSLDEPGAYAQTPDRVKAMLASYSDVVQDGLRYYRKWSDQFDQRLTTFKTRMDALTEELRTKVEQLRTEKAALETHRKAFSEALDGALRDLTEMRNGLSRRGSAASELTQKLAESVRHDVQTGMVITTALDIGMRVTTGLSLAGLISQKDGKRISTLISTAGEVAGIVRGTTEYEIQRTASDTKELGIGSETHG